MGPVGNLAFFDIFNTLPINSGGDWIRYQVLSELSSSHNITGYYTLSDNDSEGLVPEKVQFKEEHIGSEIDWSRFPKQFEAMRPEHLLTCPKKFRKANFDAVFFSTLTFHIANAVAKRSKAPLIMLMHNIEWKYFKEKGLLTQLPICAYETYAMMKSDAVVTISPADYAYIKKIAPKKKVFYVPPMEKEAIFKPTGKSFNYGDDKFNLLFYGSLDREMNIAALKFIVYDVLNEIEKKHLQDRIRINIFGSGKPPSFLENEGRINYLGRVNDPSEYIRGADAVIVPVRNGGGVKIRILEALSCNKPVVITPECAKGLSETKREMVFIANNAEGFVNQIMSIMNGQRKPLTTIKSQIRIQTSCYSDVLVNVVGNLKHLSQEAYGNIARG